MRKITESILHKKRAVIHISLSSGIAAVSAVCDLAITPGSLL